MKNSASRENLDSRLDRPAIDVEQFCYLVAAWLSCKLWLILRPGIAIRLKFADSSIICMNL